MANAGRREAEFGNTQPARQDAIHTLSSGSGRDGRVLAASALARIGDITQANRLIQELEKSYASDHMLTLSWLPCIRAAIDLHNGNAAAALPQLQVQASYELGWPTNWATTLYPIYLRGESYLQAKDGATAAGEFPEADR